MRVVSTKGGMINKFDREKNTINQINSTYWQNRLKPLQKFIEINRSNNQLRLSTKKLADLSELIYQLLEIRVDFTTANLSVLERLNLVLSLFINSSEERSKVLCTTPGTLRIASCRTNEKLETNNRLHAVFIAMEQGILQLASDRVQAKV